MAKLTRVPDVIIELSALIAAQDEIDARAVIVGGRSVNEYLDYIVFVGYNPISEEWVASTRDAPRGFRANDGEVITLGMLIAATDSNDDMTAALRRAGQKVAAVERVITENPTLGLGSGVTATVGNMAWQPLHTTKGAECNVTFDITAKVLL